MKIVILAQEDPICFSPMFRAVINAIPEEIEMVAIAGHRGAGGHPRSFLGKISYIYLLYRMMEWKGFFKNLAIKLKYFFIHLFRMTGTSIDHRTIMGAAAKHSIPIHKVRNVNGEDFINKLKEIEPDIVINQSEMLLKKPLLEVPKMGFLNRHGSMLPHFRGRLATFWGHKAEPPEYAVTVHFVDEGIDTGPIVHQEKLDINPRFCYAGVLNEVFTRSSGIILKALDKLRDPNFVPIANEHEGTPLYGFPMMKDVKEYLKVVQERRDPVAVNHRVGGSPEAQDARRASR